MTMTEDKIRELEQEAKDLPRKHEQHMRQALRLRCEMKTMETRMAVVEATLKIMRSRVA